MSCRPRLANRGITLSVSQVHRLVTGTPERLSLPVLAALCDILQVTPDDLITVTAQPSPPAKQPPPAPAPPVTLTSPAAGPGQDPPRAVTARDPRRFDRTCARCGRYGPAPIRWPDGHVCRGCFEDAMRVHGRCPGCGYMWLLPGRDDHGNPLCPDCAGITRSFRCTHCWHEGHLHAGHLCTRCVLHDQLTTLLDDGTGHTRPELVPLLESLHAMPEPDRGLNWLRNNAHPNTRRQAPYDCAPSERRGADRFLPCWRLHPRADSRAGLDRAGGLGCGWRRSRPVEF